MRKKALFFTPQLSLSRARVFYARFEHQNARKIRRSSSMLIISALLFSQPMFLKCLRPIADQDKQTKSVQHRSALRISPLIWRQLQRHLDIYISKCNCKCVVPVAHLIETLDLWARGCRMKSIYNHISAFVRWSRFYDRNAFQSASQTSCVISSKFSAFLVSQPDHLGVLLHAL